MHALQAQHQDDSNKKHYRYNNGISSSHQLTSHICLRWRAPRARSRRIRGRRRRQICDRLRNPHVDLILELAHAIVHCAHDSGVT